MQPLVGGVSCNKNFLNSACAVAQDCRSIPLFQMVVLVVLQLSYLGVRDNVITGTIPNTWSNLTQVSIRTTACLHQ